MPEETMVMDQTTEINQVPEVSQSDLADQAFDALFGPDEVQEQPKTAPTAENKQETPAPAPVKTEEQKPVTQEKPQKLEGIYSTFFKEENGQHVFDFESANKIFSAKPQYEFKGPQLADDSTVPKEPPKDPIDELWEEREKYQQTLENGSTVWRKFFDHALSGGYDAKVAMAYADAETNKIIQKEVEKKMLDLQKEHWKRQELKTQEQARFNELSEKAGSNERYLEQLAGGKDNYEKIMYSPNYGGKVLHWLYSTTNNQPQTQSQYKEGFSKWVVNFFAVPENASMAYNLAIGLLQNDPKIRKAYSDMTTVQRDKQARDSLKTTSQKPSGLRPAVKTSQQDGLSSWLNDVGGLPSV